MKFFIKTIYLIFTLSLFLLSSTKGFSRDDVNKHTKEEVSNYLSGVLSLNQNNIEKSFHYFNKTKSLKKIHLNYNVNFIRSLILLGKFEEALAW